MSNPRASLTEQLRRSVVKLYTVRKKPDYYQPWSFLYQEDSGGSGCIIEGHRIMTNAHVVSDLVYIQVVKTGDVKKYTAKVEFVDHASELALLTVEDPRFFEGTLPVSFGELPQRQEKVAVYGFPVGGSELSITEGVVSRLEVRSYTHSKQQLLTIQTDASINAGNSGGPVFHQDGKMIGIAFQTQGSSGYLVPVPVIKHFLQDLKNGLCDGIPSLGIFWQKMESDVLKEYFQLKQGQTGILITRVVYGTSAWGVLQEEDVLLAVDGQTVESDGSVLLRQDDRVGFSYLITQRQVGEKIRLSLLRKGTPLELEVTLGVGRHLVPRPLYDVRPTYFIFGGLVLMPLTHNYISRWDWKDVESHFRYYYQNQLPSPRRKEVIILNRVLVHDINVGYHQMRNAIVDRINGVEITEMKDVLAAVQRPVGAYHVFELDDCNPDFGARLVLSTNGIEQANQEILTRYGISSDRSADLLK